MNSVSHKDWTHLWEYKDPMVISMTGSGLNPPTGMVYGNICKQKTGELYGTFSQLVLNRKMAWKKKREQWQKLPLKERLVGWRWTCERLSLNKGEGKTSKLLWLFVSEKEKLLEGGKKKVMWGIRNSATSFLMKRSRKGHISFCHRKTRCSD